MFVASPLRAIRAACRFLLALSLAFAGFAGAARGQIIDAIVFGDAASESAHALNAPQTQVIGGGLGQPARKMAWDPTDTVAYEGGYLEFTAKCDPLKLNYVTLKLWGSDTNATASGILLLYQVLEGQLLQVGYRDVQVSEFAPLAWAARSEMTIPNRFYYTTIPLPLSLTQGRTSVQLRVVGTYMNSNGSLPVYRAYVHEGAYFEPAPGDPQGSAPAPAPVRPSALGAIQTALDKARQTTISNMNSWLANNNGDLNQLIAGYNVAWTPAYQNALVPPRARESLDATCRGHFANPGKATSDWGGSYGGEGATIRSIGAAGFGSALDEVVDLGDPAGPAPRRVLWAKMLTASRNQGQFGRRGPTTNQSILSDKEFYDANSGLQVLGSPDALPEEHAKRFLLESVGLQPWMGGDQSDGTPGGWMGSDYYLVTPAGLTKENGYVSAYGEIYDVSTGYYGQTGDDRFRVRGVEMLKARSYFRYPMVDDSGYRSFRMVGPLDWRAQETFPYDQAYGERGARLAVALATKHPTAIGYAWQMFEDGQGDAFGTDLDSALALETLVHEPDSGERLPNTEGQPDYAWCDVDNGVVAIKRGEELTWIEPYWQSRGGLHSIGRVMQITPTAARVGTVRSDLLFPWAGSWSSKSDATGWNGTPLSTPQGLVHQAYFNDKILQPVPPATAPAGTTREEFIGRASFYATRYGRYLVGINMDKTKSYELRTPPGFTSALDLLTRQTKSGTITVAPFSAVVLDLGVNVDPNPLPSAPKLVTTSPIAGGVAVVWETSGGATSYTVKRATSAAGPFTTLATGLGAAYPKKWGAWPFGSYFDTATSAGTSYFYKVTAVNAAGESYDSPVPVATQPGTSVASVNVLPAQWKNVNFSNGGSASYEAATGTFTLKGGGGDFWANADGGHFVYQAAIGDGDLVARLTNPGSAYKTGVMIRTSLATNSAEICYTAQSSALGGFKRGATGSGTSFFGAGDTRPNPVWFKMERRGNNVTFYSAVDAAGAPGAWVNRGTGNISFNAIVYVGIATTSGTPTFDNVSVTGFGATTPVAPAAPADLTATPGNGAVTINWTPASRASTYTVKRGLAASGPFSAVASGLTALSYTNTALTNGTAYYYVVTATNAQGESASSPVVTATPSAIPAPPTNLVVTPSGTQAVLTWNAASGATGYTVLRSVDGITWTTVATLSGTTYTDAGLANGLGYFYAVAASNSNGSSANTASVPITTAPPAPRLVDAAGTDTQARLRWDGVAGASSYTLSRATVSGGPYSVVASGLTSPSYLETNLTSQGTYFYRVAASNAAGQSAPSAEMKLGWGTGLLGRYYNTGNFSGAPVITRVDPTITFNWGQSSPEPGVLNVDNFSTHWTGQFEAPATGSYTFAAGNADDYFAMTINGVSVLKNQSATTNLTAGVKYDLTIDFADYGGAAYFSVKCLINDEPARDLPTSRLYPEVPLSRVTGGTATANAPRSSSDVSAAKAFDGDTGTKWYTSVNGISGWLQSTAPAGTSWVITKYALTSANDVSQRDPKNWKLQGSNNGTTWTDLDTQTSQTFASRYLTNTYPISNTAAFSSYRLSVSANAGGSGYGIQLSELSLYKVDALPAPPGNLTASPGYHQVALSWPAVAGASGYVIKRSSYSGGPFTVVNSVASTTNFTDDGVANGRTYFYVVSSMVGGVQGENSRQTSVTVPMVVTPEIPTGLAALAGNAVVDLSWNGTSGATGYILRRSLNSASGYTVLTSGSALTFKDAGVANGTTYYYTVAAANAAGTSADSSPTSALPKADASTAAPELTFENGSAQIHLATSAAGHTYQLQRSYTLASGSWVSLGAPKSGGGPLDFADTTDPQQPSVFYRLLIGP